MMPEKMNNYWKGKIMNKLDQRIVEEDYSFLSGKTVLVTGATGLIGKALIQTFLKWNKTHQNCPIIISAAVRDKKRAIDCFGSSDINYIVGDIRTVDFGNIYADYIVHGASQTSSKSFVNRPIEVISVAVDGTRHVLDYAVKAKVKGVIYLSSMEVYGTPKTDDKITERYSSNIDTTEVRSCYPESKRMCENICISYMREYDVPVAILRLTQTFGEGVEYNEQRVFAEFARCVIENKDIILMTKGETKRSYLYIQDAINAIALIMYKGKYGEAYNVANEETYCSIYEMAQLVAEEISGGKISVKVEQTNNEKLGFAPTLHMNLDTSKIRNLGWKPSIGLRQMYEIMINNMQKKGI